LNTTWVFGRAGLRETKGLHFVERLNTKDFQANTQDTFGSGKYCKADLSHIFFLILDRYGLERYAD
jgi:hypothetical protein